MNLLVKIMDRDILKIRYIMLDFIKNLFVKDEEEDLLTKLPDNVVLLNHQGSFLWYNDLAQKTLTEIKETFSEGYIDDIFDNAM